MWSQAEGNVGNDHVRGVDFETNYNMGLDMIGWDNAGDLNFNYRGTWVLENNTLFTGASDASAPACSVRSAASRRTA